MNTNTYMHRYHMIAEYIIKFSWFKEFHMTFSIANELQNHTNIQSYTTVEFSLMSLSSLSFSSPLLLLLLVYSSLLKHILADK